MMRLQQVHRDTYAREVSEVRPLPGAREPLAYLSQAGIPWIIATSGRREIAEATVRVLGLDAPAPLVTRDDVRRAKPDPDLFLAAAERLGVPVAPSVGVGDGGGDWLAARRAGAPAVGLRSAAIGLE